MNANESSIDSQWAVLGGMVWGGPYIVHQVTEAGLTADHFDHPGLSLTFQTLVEIADAHGVIDKPSLRRSLSQQFKDSAIDGPSSDMVIETIYDTAFTAATAVYHATRVRDAAQMRSARSRLALLLSEATNWEGSAAEFVASAQESMLSLASGVDESRRALLADVMPSFWETLKSDYANPNGLVGLDTGFPRLNRMIRGLCPGNLIIIAAELGYGKSALAANIAINAARRSQAHVSFFSLEMEMKEILRRLLFSEARVPSQRYFDRQLTDADWARMTEAAKRLERLPISVFDDPNVTVPRIIASCRAAKFAGMLDLVVVDYTQLITPALNPNNRRSADNREREITQIVESLKKMAGELKIPVIALSQLNDDGKMRESRSIKNSANVVMVLRTDDKPDEGSETMNYTLTLEKVRDGQRGDVPLVFYPAFTRFQEEAFSDHL